MFSSFYVDRGSHYSLTRVAGGKVDKFSPTQVGRSLKQLGISQISAYSPQARGRSERMFGTWQGRLPQELKTNNISTMENANKYIEDIFLPRMNEFFKKNPTSSASGFTSYIGRDIKEILSIQKERVVNKDNTVHYKNFILQLEKSDCGEHYAGGKVMVHHYENEMLDIFFGPRKIASFNLNKNNNQIEENYEILKEKKAKG